MHIREATATRIQSVKNPNKKTYFNQVSSNVTAGNVQALSNVLQGTTFKNWANVCHAITAIHNNAGQQALSVKCENCLNKAHISKI
jgi:hypothetical protein